MSTSPYSATITMMRYLLNIFCFKFCAISSGFLGHGKIFIESLVYQVYLYGFFSIAQQGSEGSKLATWIPDGYWWFYEKACQEHDECYSRCGNTKNFCDIQFLKRGAVLYAGAVMASKDSKEAYNSAQKKAGCCNECIS